MITTIIIVVFLVSIGAVNSMVWVTFLTFLIIMSGLMAKYSQDFEWKDNSNGSMLNKSKPSLAFLITCQNTQLHYVGGNTTLGVVKKLVPIAKVGKGGKKQYTT